MLKLIVNEFVSKIKKKSNAIGIYMVYIYLYICYVYLYIISIWNLKILPISVYVQLYNSGILNENLQTGQITNIEERLNWYNYDIRNGSGNNSINRCNLGTDWMKQKDK